ncbi:MAG: DNA starvation/stationary phase protection protein [Solirubrobacterales bacterium]
MNPSATETKLKELLPSHPSLSEHERHDVANQLQATLVDLIDLSLIGKQYHWNVVGGHFRSLHLMLDELIDTWRELSDTVAERVTALGICPDGRASTVAADSEVAKVADGPLKDTDIYQQLTERLGVTIAKLNERRERVGEIDPASEDVLIECARALEMNHWMLAAQQA